MAENCAIGMINPSKNTCKACGYRCTEEGLHAFLNRDTRKAFHKAHARNGRTANKKGGS